VNTTRDALVIAAVGLATTAVAGTLIGFFGASARHISHADAEAHLRRISRGNAIDVWYDPADPSQAVNHRGVPWGLWAVLALGMIFLAGGTLPMLLGQAKG
jgi:hypothetical protein